MLNMSGSSTIQSSVFRDAAVNNVYWTPTSGAATVTATGSTFGPNDAATGGSGLLLDATGTAIPTLSISGGSFTGNRGDSLRPAFSGSASGNVTVATGHIRPSGVNFSVDGDADLTYNVTGSTFLRHASHAMQMIVNDTVTSSSEVRGTVASNAIGDSNADSGWSRAGHIVRPRGRRRDLPVGEGTRSATPIRRASSSRRGARTRRPSPARASI